ncbi:baculoviral IAP repeat-containing protein 7 [Nyctibius grandis]|uniref:baculoviral IAP repeat-containing protein 7 n=1 Tax=Nyctibius grandis TaxID=48427 RepID=UPI0035BBF9F1
MVLKLARNLIFFLKVSKYLRRFSLNSNMGDMTPAEEMELGAARCQLFESSMRNEARRRRTFWEWPDNAAVLAGELAKAGFFFVGPRDEVQCFCCGGLLKDWSLGDNPMAEHLKFFPSCKFICGEDVGNQEMLPLEERFDIMDGQLLSLLQGLGGEERALPDEPENPDMVTEEMRLSTFQNWPQYTDMHPEQLARAGFFYTGESDVVRCFYCDGGVRNWSFGDDPWREHAKWYPGCEFLLQSRGREFISSVQDSVSSTLLSPRDSWDQTEQDLSASQDAVQRATETSSSREEVQSLPQKESDEPQMSTEEQLRRLQEERMCKVCMDKDVSVVFVPCGHLVACGECALNLRLCPICRTVIRGSVRTFMS